jgi:hypothetical protein
MNGCVTQQSPRRLLIGCRAAATAAVKGGVSRRVPREPLTASRRAGYPCAPYLTHHSNRTSRTYRLSEEVLSYTAERGE